MTWRSGWDAIYRTLKILPGNERVRPDDLPREQKWGDDARVEGQEDVHGCPLVEDPIARVGIPDVTEHHVTTLSRADLPDNCSCNF